MRNEILIILTLFAFNGFVLIMMRLFGRTGLYIWNTVATILANIEVIALVKAFGMEVTLGNSLIASTCIVTDILNEFYGEKNAGKAVWICVVTQMLFILVTRTWFLYVPSENDGMLEHLRLVFASTPRVILGSLFAYAVSSMLDIKIYRLVWKLCEKYGKDRNRGLWIRNNVSTVISKLIDVIVFHLLAFTGIFPAQTVVQAGLFCYLFYFAGTLLSTPFMYIARSMVRRTPALLQ